MNFQLVLWIATLCVTLHSCQTPGQRSASQAPKLRPGFWLLHFDISMNVPEVQIPVRLQVDSSGKIIVLNHEEKVLLEPLYSDGDSLVLKAQLFQTFLHCKLLSDSTISGYLAEPQRSADYLIPFTGTIATAPQFNSEPVRQLVYETTFSPGAEGEEYKAIALLEQQGLDLHGTFLTETGDYRYLSGRLMQPANERQANFELSCWDGAHLFYFEGQIASDSIRHGLFCSGLHWHETWEGRYDTYARLRDPDSLTTLKPHVNDFQFTALNTEGKPVKFGPDQFKNSVTIVQLFGSWCPNCTDESIFFRDLYSRYADRGLHIVPVAFERPADPMAAAPLLKEQFRELDIPYEPYIGGQKGKALETFPMLNHVMSMPTSIFIDKKGKVRKIHTGFYGPGTGEYYRHYTERIESFVVQLLSEK